MTTIKEMLIDAIENKSLSELKDLVLWSNKKSGTIQIKHKKSATIAPEFFNSLYLVHIKPDKTRIRSDALVNVVPKLNLSCGNLDSYSLEQIDNFHSVYASWANLNEDHHYRKLFKQATLDYANGGVEIDYSEAKKRMIRFNELYPEYKDDIQMMDLTSRLFRKNHEMKIK